MKFTRILMGAVVFALLAVPAVSEEAAMEEASMKADWEGTFVWHDLMTPDGEAATEFYTTLFGWTAEAQDMGEAGPYTTFKKAGVDVGGMVAMELPEGVPPHWMGYICTENLDASLETVESSGGAVHFGPLPVEGIGRFAVVGDPQGAAVSLFQFDEIYIQNATIAEGPGTFFWNELMTNDVEGGKKFFTNLAGWDNEVWDLEELGEYTIFSQEGKMICGMMAIPEGLEMPPSWCYYVQVEDVDATFKRALELGASGQMPPTDIPDVGRFAVFFDPQGAHLAIFKASEHGKVNDEKDLMSEHHHEH